MPRKALFDIKWIDGMREPKSAPSAAYPNGINLDLTAGRVPACKADLPYPAPRIGRYMIECTQCGLKAIVTTAGRRDDPRSIVLACKGKS